MSAVQLEFISDQMQSGLAYQLLRLRLLPPDGVIQPSDLQGLELPEGLKLSQGIVLEGRGPIWLYGYLVHLCHPAAWVGCYDPRLEGAVVVETHTPGVAVGQVIALTLP